MSDDKAALTWFDSFHSIRRRKNNRNDAEKKEKKN